MVYPETLPRLRAKATALPKLVGDIIRPPRCKQQQQLNDVVKLHAYAVTNWRDGRPLQ